MIQKSLNKQFEKKPGVLEIQHCKNSSSQGNRERASTHRTKVTSLLLEAISLLDCEAKAIDLALIGAGNCHDVELSELINSYEKIHLIDIDREAVLFGLVEQKMLSSPDIVLEDSFDVTGIDDWKLLTDPGWESSSLKHTPFCNRKFHVTASIFLLSQLIETLTHFIPDTDGRFIKVLQAIRQQHIHRLLQSTKPGGVCYLFCDCFSSDSCPMLIDTPEDQLPQLMSQCIEQQNFFHGMNPFRIGELLDEDPILHSLIADWEPVIPWKWNLGIKQYAVTAFRMHRNSKV